MKTIGVIGLNGVGEDRLKSFAKNADVTLHSICTRNESLLARRAKEFGVSNTTTDWQSMLADDTLDAVCISTPNYLHFSMAEAFMRAGKDVLLEYPMGITVDEADKLVAIAEETGRILHLGLSTRYEPQHLAIKELLPEMGQPVEVHCSLAWPELWKWAAEKEVCGSYMALAPFHFADQAIDFFGDPTWVTGSRIDLPADGPTEQINGSMFFGYDTGLSVYVNYAMGMPVQSEFSRFELIFTKGRITFYDDVLTVYRGSDAGQVIDLPTPDGIRLETDRFVVELHGEPMDYPPARAAVSTRLCVLADQSAAHGHETLTL
jgi:predicted dehydrogenase